MPVEVGSIRALEPVFDVLPSPPDSEEWFHPGAVGSESLEGRAEAFIWFRTGLYLGLRLSPTGSCPCRCRTVL